MAGSYMARNRPGGRLRARQFPKPKINYTAYYPVHGPFHKEDENTQSRTSGERIPYVVILDALIIVVVLGAALSITYSSHGSPNGSTSSSLEPLPKVTVFGLVGTMGAGTHPTALVFASVKQAQSFVAPVSDGRFSIDLPNQDAYNVSLRWAGNYTWQSGQIDRGELTLNMSSGSTGAQSYNVVQATPDSVIRVDGSLFWQIQSSSPVAIRFTAVDGEEFNGTVSNRTFSITLPNMMTYEVYVQSRNSTGYADWYYFHQLQVDAGVNVVGVTVRLGN